MKLIGIKKVAGGSVTESELVHGIAFKKTFAYAGFEQQTKKFTNPKILCLNVELELKSEKENSFFRISVLGGGCSGFQYDFSFTNIKNADDDMSEPIKISLAIKFCLPVNEKELLSRLIS